MIVEFKFDFLWALGMESHWMDAWVISIRSRLSVKELSRRSSLLGSLNRNQGHIYIFRIEKFPCKFFSLRDDLKFLFNDNAGDNGQNTIYVDNLRWSTTNDLAYLFDTIAKIERYANGRSGAWCNLNFA